MCDVHGPSAVRVPLLYEKNSTSCCEAFARLGTAVLLVLYDTFCCEVVWCCERCSVSSAARIFTAVQCVHSIVVSSAMTCTAVQWVPYSTSCCEDIVPCNVYSTSC